MQMFGNARTLKKVALSEFHFLPNWEGTTVVVRKVHLEMDICSFRVLPLALLWRRQIRALDLKWLVLL